MQLDQVIDEFEREILRGRARWVADINETFRDYPVGGQSFDVCARGQTRGKGFLLSRFFAWTVLPNYKVSLYAKAIPNTADFHRGNLIQLLHDVRMDKERRDVKWAWLVLFLEDAPPRGVANVVETYDRDDLGIGCVNVNSGNVLVNRNLLGSSLLKQMRLHRMIFEFERRQSRQGSAS